MELEGGHGTIISRSTRVVERELPPVLLKVREIHIHIVILTLVVNVAVAQYLRQIIFNLPKLSKDE